MVFSDGETPQHPIFLACHSGSFIDLDSLSENHQIKKMNHSTDTHKIYWKILLLLASIKMSIHLFTNTITAYGLHRDEYLYISESDHLAWGYMEVPPMLSIIGKIAKLLFGHTEFAVRFFPAFIGAISIILIGILIRDLGGKKYAQLLGGFGFLISPVFLGSNNLFQPVSFNQFMWLLSAFMMVRIIRDLTTEKIHLSVRKIDIQPKTSPPLEGRAVKFCFKRGKVPACLAGRLNFFPKILISTMQFPLLKGVRGMFSGESSKYSEKLSNNIPPTPFKGQGC